MEYEIVITKREKNPDYTPCHSPYEKEKPQYLSTRDLFTVLTEEEFKAIKKAVLEVM
jgi:hypothetical protein